MFFFTVFVIFAVAYGSPDPEDITIKDVVKAFKTCLTNFPPELKGSAYLKLNYDKYLMTSLLR